MQCRRVRTAQPVDVDRRQLVGRGLKDVPIVVSLYELAPVGGRATGRQDWRRLERVAEVCQDLPNRPRTVDECDEPDVAAARGARKLTADDRKLWPHMLERRGARLKRLCRPD
jgi:hypothetical protein